MTPKLPGTSRQSPQGQAQQNRATLLGVVFLVLFALGFLALITAILPDAAGLLLLLAAGVGFFAFHYLTWGRWLTRHLRETGEMVDDD